MAAMASSSSRAGVGKGGRLPVSFVFSAILLSSTNERNANPTRFITSMNTGFDGETVTSSMRRNYHAKARQRASSVGNAACCTVTCTYEKRNQTAGDTASSYGGLSYSEDRQAGNSRIGEPGPC